MQFVPVRRLPSPIQGLRLVLNTHPFPFPFYYIIFKSYRRKLYVQNQKYIRSIYVSRSMNFIFINILNCNTPPPQKKWNKKSFIYFSKLIRTLWNVAVYMYAIRWKTDLGKKPSVIIIVLILFYINKSMNFFY